MDEALLAAAFWGLWRGRRQQREWQNDFVADIERLTTSDPESVELTVSGLRNEIGDRLDFSVKQMRQKGYRLVRVVPQDSELSWTALFERVRQAP